MIGHMTGHINPAPKNTQENGLKKRVNLGFQREEILHTIDNLYALSRRGLWKLLLFLGISAVALYFKSYDLFAVCPENIREVLGAPPPKELIHIVLAVSTISALILIGRDSDSSAGGSGWIQFGMSAIFYPLYAMTNTLEANFPAVFVAGLLIISIEYVTVWFQTSRTIHEEKERLGLIN